MIATERSHFKHSFANLLRRMRPGNIVPTAIFKELLQNERALADRNGRIFSLLTYDVSNCPTSDIDRLVRIIEIRIRETDDIGWAEAGILGVLLRQTSHAGALDLSHSLETRLALNNLAIPCRVMSYPESNEAIANLGEHTMPLGPDALHSQMLSLMTRPIPLWKRTVDVTVSAAVLLVLLPLLLLTALYIVVVAPGPVFFKQDRVGFLGRRFQCLKFRSMKANVSTDVHRAHLQHLINSNTPMQKLDDKKDSRIIPLGRLIRACALDEIPQLINVLRGDMSLVGPRPCLPYEFETFLRWHKRRFDTLPGLTDLWQVSGKNHTTFGEMMRLDITYEQKRSFLMDLKIIAKTPLVIIEQLAETVNPPNKEHAYESAN